MKHGKTWLFMATVLIAALRCDADPPFAMRGVKTVRVDADLTGFDGIQEGELKTVAELRLRVAGITVGGDGPYLRISINILKIEDASLYAIAYQARFNQWVNTNTGATGDATTWSTAMVGYAGTSKIRESLRNAVGEMADAFANEFLKQNQPIRITR